MIVLDNARQRIQPIENLLIDSHKMAAEKWHELLTEHPALALPLDRTARANYIHCHLESVVTRRIEGVASVGINDRLGFFALTVGNQILLRFKFVGNSDGAPRNVPTTQQRLLAHQTYDERMVMALTGDTALLPPTLLTCGYTLTDQAEIDRIEIRRDCIGHLPWAFDIYGGEAVVEPLVFDGMADEAKPAKVTSSRKTERKDEGSETAG